MWFFGKKKKNRSKLYKEVDVYRVKRNRFNHIVSSGMRWKNDKYSTIVYGVGRRNTRKKNYLPTIEDKYSRDKAYYDSLMKKDYRSLTTNEIKWLEYNGHFFDD